MVDAEHLIRDELDRLAPASATGLPGWGDVLRRAVPAPPRRRRRVRLVATAAVVVAVAVPALAFSASVRTLFGLDPSPAVTDEATHIVSAPVGNGFFAHWWHSPSTTGGGCSFRTVDRSLEPPEVPASMGAGVCGGSADDDRARAERPIQAGVSIGRRPPNVVPANWVPPIIAGSVYEGLHAARVQVEWHGGRLPLVLRDGYFLGGGPRLYMPPFAAFPFYVVAYDGHGREVARTKLQSPALRLMSHGWKQYVREYLAWKRAQG